MTNLSYIEKKEPAFIVTLHHWLLVSCFFSCSLLLGRIVVTGLLGYIFLPWNLFLAFLPYWLTGYMIKKKDIASNKIKLLLALGLWLLFIPNSFYIMTDLVHFARIRSAPKWFDLLMIFSFAWNGIFFGIISMGRVELIITEWRGKRFSVVLLFIVMWLCAFGIYIGRYLRYNSWDIITNPFSLAEEIADMLIRPFDHGYAWGMTICYALFMTFLYVTVKKLGEFFIVSKSY
jgi:uncharacterized membrane protein